MGSGRPGAGASPPAAAPVPQPPPWTVAHLGIRRRPARGAARRDRHGPAQLRGYGPQFGQAIPGDVGVLHLPWFDWPASPSWLYRLTQGLHVGLGLVLVPVVLAKLWSVAPKLFAWPPVRSPAQALERLSLLLLVGGILFEIVTGLLNIQYDYVFGFSFYAAHYVGAWVFLGAFVAHVALKLPHMVRGLRSRSLRAELRTPTSETRPEEPDDDLGLVAERPGPATVSRRGALALVGGGSLLVAALTAGQTLGGPLRSLAVLLPRGRNSAAADGGPNDFPVNKTFAVTGIEPGAVGATWRLDLTGGAALVRLDRDALAAQPAAHRDAAGRVRRGVVDDPVLDRVRLRDLAALAGVPEPASAVVRSLENGPFAQATLTSGQVLHPDALLALAVNGAPLAADHGYPARVVVPALPGVHNTKWVRSIEFRSS